MTIAPEFLWALLAMAVASFACRAGGFALMRFVPVTPRLEAGLKAIPIGVMLGIVAPVAASGRLPEIAGLGAVLVMMKLTGSDLAAALSGVAAVALLRLIA
jgi:uncharacterized membrane protein